MKMKWIYLSYLSSTVNKLEKQAAKKKLSHFTQKQNEEKEKAFSFLDKARVKMYAESSKK